MMPKLVEMAAEYTDVKFVKCNCNKEFKDIGKALAIKVAPTFHLYRGGKQLAVMTGAKVDELRELILTHR
jgi:thioredoxin 1